MCHGLLSSPIVAHFSLILKGNPLSTLASDILPLPLLTDKLNHMVCPVPWNNNTIVHLYGFFVVIAYFIILSQSSDIQLNTNDSKSKC